MIHYFDIDVAKEFGVDQAVMIANFQYWISHNVANKKNFFEDKFWTFNSYKAFSILFPYYSEKQVRRIIGNLIEKGVLIDGNFNQKDYDNTKWYTFADPAKWLQNIPSAHLGSGGPAQMGKGGAQTGKGGAQTGKPIPDIVPQLKNSVVVPPLFPNGNIGGGESSINESGDPKADKKAKKKNSPPQKKESTLYSRMVETYFVWHNDFIGVDPIFNGEAGKAMKGLVQYISIQAKKRMSNSGLELVAEVDIENAAVETWSALLDALRYSDKIEPFLKNQTKLSQIYSNLTNIIKQLKNGNGKGITTNKSAGVDEIERELQLARNMAGG